MSSYGLKITGNAGQFIVDSDDLNAEYLTISQFGAISANQSIEWNPTKEFLLVKADPGSQIRGSTDFEAQASDKTKVNFSTALDYIKVTRTSQVSNLFSTENYGLEVLNSSNTLVFSTKSIKQGIAVQKVYNHAELVTHNQTIFTGSTTDIYVSIGGWMYTDIMGGVVGGFSYSANTITWNSLIAINFMGIGSISLPNSGSLLIVRALGLT